MVETSYFNPPYCLHNILLRIKSKGYAPVLVHPERYVYMEPKAYEQQKRLNVLFNSTCPPWWEPTVRMPSARPSSCWRTYIISSKGQTPIGCPHGKPLSIKTNSERRSADSVRHQAEPSSGIYYNSYYLRW